MITEWVLWVGTVIGILFFGYKVATKKRKRVSGLKPNKEIEDLSKELDRIRMEPDPKTAQGVADEFNDRAKNRQ